MASLIVGVWSRRRANVCQELGATLGHVGFSSPLAQTTSSSMSSLQGNHARVKIKIDCMQVAH